MFDSNMVNFRMLRLLGVYIVWIVSYRTLKLVLVGEDTRTDTFPRLKKPKGRWSYRPKSTGFCAKEYAV